MTGITRRRKAATPPTSLREALDFPGPPYSTAPSTSIIVGIMHMPSPCPHEPSTSPTYKLMHMQHF